MKAGKDWGAAAKDLVWPQQPPGQQAQASWKQQHQEDLQYIMQLCKS